jgi:hypothetical protein
MIIIICINKQGSNMLKQYVELFLETSFVNQSETFSDILNSVHDQHEIERRNKENKTLGQENTVNKDQEQENTVNKDLEQTNIDFETYSSLLNRGPRPRGLQFISTSPKKRQ